MKLREYRVMMEKLINDDSKTLDMDVVYSTDDEGNNFQPVHYGPCKGRWEDFGEFSQEEEDCNAVCINQEIYMLGYTKIEYWQCDLCGKRYNEEPKEKCCCYISTVYSDKCTCGASGVKYDMYGRKCIACGRAR